MNKPWHGLGAESVCGLHLGGLYANRATSPNGLVGKRVRTILWQYVPSFDGEDVDRDILGEVIGTVQSINQVGSCVIKLEQFRANYVNAEWTEDLAETKLATGWQDGELHEWFYNLDVLA